MDKTGLETMMGYLYDLPRQFEEILQYGFERLDSYRRDYSNVVISGLGGSAIGGDILRTFSLEKAPVPILVNRGYSVPAFVGAQTLFITVSYSGNTEETLQSYLKARDQGAAIVCITSGGKLKEKALADGNGVISIPGGLAPRAATGYLFAPTALFLEFAEIITGVRPELEETITVLDRLREQLHPGVNEDENPARQIARRLKGNLPVIWGSAGLSEAAAMRWKGQINENAKSPAFYNVFPELNHNEIVGFEAPTEVLEHLAIVILQDRFDYERVQLRMEITSRMIEGKTAGIIYVHSQGESFLARLYSLIYMGDYSSVYLAMEYGIDPTPVKVIDALKEALARA